MDSLKIKNGKAENRIGILIPNKKVFKEYLELFPYNELENQNHIMNIYGYNFSLPTHDSQKISFLKFSEKLNTLIHYCNLWRRREVNLSYKLRAINYFGSKKDRKFFSSWQSNQYSRYSFSKKLLVKFFATSFGIKLLMFFQESIAFKFESISKNYIEDLNLIILPYAGGIDLNFDFLVWYARKKKIKTIAIQENWDNLSSKSFLIQKPDHFLTWGLQSSSHLRNFQNYRGKVQEVGSLRLEQFYKFESNSKYPTELISKPSQLNFDNKIRLLVIGTGDATYDLRVLNFLYNASKFNKKITLVYRPHPYSRISNHDLNKISLLVEIFIDMPKLDEANDYRIELILNADFIVSLYSTVLLEASILGKKSIIPSFISNNYVVDAGDYLDDAPHYAGLASLSNIFNPRVESEFWEIIFDRDIVTEPKHERNLLNWICSSAPTKTEIFLYLTKTLNA
jgi:hypothetical protein